HRAPCTSLELVETSARARAPCAIEEVHASGRRLVIQAEEVAPHAAEIGLGDGEHAVGGDGRVDDIAARPERLDPRQRGQRMTRSDYGLAPHGRLTMRVANLDACARGRPSVAAWTHAWGSPWKMRVISSCGKLGMALAWPPAVTTTPASGRVTRPLAGHTIPAAGG